MKDLETQNLRIRKFKIEDTMNVYENLVKEEELKDKLSESIHTIDEARMQVYSFIKEYEMNEFVWAIEEKKSNIVIGYIRSIESSKVNRCCEIHFSIGYKWTDSNYMEEALGEVIDYLFNVEKFSIIISKFCDGNKELAKNKSATLENVGMMKEAVLRNRKINERTGISENKIVYSIVEEEFKKEKKVC